jgi:hypothetical protein
MTLTITIPDESATEFLDDVCNGSGYDAASNKTKAQWAQEQAVKSLKGLALNGAMKQASVDARAGIEAAGIS